MNERLEFDLESQLVKILEERASCRTNSPFARDGAELLVFHEVTMGATIPDLVIVRTSSLREGSRKIRLNGFQSWVVSELLRVGAISDSGLTQRLYARLPSTRDALQKLQKMGVVRLDDEGRFVVTSDFRNAFEVVSIEAKLTRWKTALEQAKTYFRFSDRAFVALPSSVVARNPLIREQCRQNGVGLIAVTPSSVDVVIDAASTGLSDHREWTWLLAKTGAFHI